MNSSPSPRSSRSYHWYAAATSRSAARYGNQPIRGHRCRLVSRSSASWAGRARPGLRRYSASRSSARRRCDSGTGTLPGRSEIRSQRCCRYRICSVFGSEPKPAGSPRRVRFAARCPFRGRNAMAPLYSAKRLAVNASRKIQSSSRISEQRVTLGQRSLPVGTNSLTREARARDGVAGSRTDRGDWRSAAGRPGRTARARR